MLEGHQSCFCLNDLSPRVSLPKETPLRPQRLAALRQVCQGKGTIPIEAFELRLHDLFPKLPDDEIVDTATGLCLALLILPMLPNRLIPWLLGDS